MIVYCAHGDEPIANKHQLCNSCQLYRACKPPSAYCFGFIDHSLIVMVSVLSLTWYRTGLVFTAYILI